ncbi:unnamed protein product [Lota lota]
MTYIPREEFPLRENAPIYLKDVQNNGQGGLRNRCWWRRGGEQQQEVEMEEMEEMEEEEEEEEVDEEEEMAISGV